MSASPPSWTHAVLHLRIVRRAAPPVRSQTSGSSSSDAASGPRPHRRSTAARPRQHSDRDLDRSPSLTHATFNGGPPCRRRRRDGSRLLDELLQLAGPDERHEPLADVDAARGRRPHQRQGQQSTMSTTPSRQAAAIIGDASSFLRQQHDTRGAQLFAEIGQVPHLLWNSDHGRRQARSRPASAAAIGSAKAWRRRGRRAAQLAHDQVSAWSSGEGRASLRTAW